MKQLTVIDQDTLDEFVFYDNSNGIILRDFEGFEYSSVKSSVDEVAGNQSGVYVNSKFGVRRISWAGDLVSDTVFTLRRQMIAVMRQTGTIKLIKFTTYDDLLLQCEAEIIKVLNPYNHSVHSFLIEAVLPDWRFLSQTLKSVSFDIDDELDATNAGDETSDVIYTIQGPSTSLNIAKSEGEFYLLLETGDYLLQETEDKFILETLADESFQITGALIAGDEVIVDTKLRTVKKNGVSAYNIFAGIFVRLNSGINSIVFTGAGTSGATNLLAEYRDSYNGI